MRILLMVCFATIIALCATSASAWCVECRGPECWMTSGNAGAVYCYSFGSSCLTTGQCAAGTVGCPEGPDGCKEPLSPTALLQRCDVVRLASLWRLESVVVRHGTAWSVSKPTAGQIALAR